MCFQLVCRLLVCNYVCKLYIVKQHNVEMTPHESKSRKHRKNFELPNSRYSKYSLFAEIVKFGWNCEIWLELWNLVEIVKFGQDCEIQPEFRNSSIFCKFYQPPCQIPCQPPCSPQCLWILSNQVSITTKVSIVSNKTMYTQMVQYYKFLRL